MQPTMTTSISLIPMKGSDHAAQSPDQQVLAQQRVGAERSILNALERDRDQQPE